MPIEAVVVDAGVRSSVAGLRGLGRAGVGVLALGSTRADAGLFSRYAADRAVAPPADADPAGFAARLGEVAAAHPGAPVYAGTEVTLQALLGDRSGKLTLPYAGADAVAPLRDKRALAPLAGEAGLAAPRTLAEGPAGELLHAAPEPPLALKPARPGGSLASTRIVGDARELAELLASLPAHEPLVAQEALRPPLIGVALVLARDGTVVARFQQAAKRTWPAAAGESSVACGIAPDEELVGRAAALLRSVGYWGLAHLQFLHGRDGLALVDVNPRFYGSLPLALASGVNLPAAWHAVATDGRLPSPAPYRVGVTYRWLEADVTAGLRGHPRRLVYRAPRPATGAFWARDDPLPAVILAADAATVRARRRLPWRPTP